MHGDGRNVVRNLYFPFCAEVEKRHAGDRLIEERTAMFHQPMLAQTLSMVGGDDEAILTVEPTFGPQRCEHASERAIRSKN